MTAPVESVTVPWIDPAPLCAKSKGVLITIAKTVAMAKMRALRFRSVCVNWLAEVVMELASPESQIWPGAAPGRVLDLLVNKLC